MCWIVGLLNCLSFLLNFKLFILQNLFLYGYGAIFNFLGIILTAIIKGMKYQFLYEFNHLSFPFEFYIDIEDIAQSMYTLGSDVQWLCFWMQHVSFFCFILGHNFKVPKWLFLGAILQLTSRKYSFTLLT